MRASAPLTTTASRRNKATAIVSTVYSRRSMWTEVWRLDRWHHNNVVRFIPPVDQFPAQRLRRPKEKPPEGCEAWSFQSSPADCRAWKVSNIKKERLESLFFCFYEQGRHSPLTPIHLWDAASWYIQPMAQKGASTPFDTTALTFSSAPPTPPPPTCKAPSPTLPMPEA